MDELSVNEKLAPYGVKFVDGKLVRFMDVDDLQTISAEWLDTFNAKKPLSNRWQVDLTPNVWIDIYLWESGQVDIAINSLTTDAIQIPSIKTRGQLRKLIAALKGE